MSQTSPRVRGDAQGPRNIRFLIGGVRYNKDRTHINRLKVHEVAEGKIQPARYMLRTEVISHLRAGDGFLAVAVGKDGKMVQGPDLVIMTLAGNDYLRTDRIDRETDFVEMVPEFNTIG